MANVQGETLSLFCGVAFQIIMSCYALILESIANEFKIHRADEKLKDKITFAKMLPFTSSQEEVNGLARALGLL